MDAVSGLDRGIVDGGTDQHGHASQDLPLDIGVTASTLPFVVNPPPIQRAFEGYSLRMDPPPNTQIDFS